MRFSRVRSGLSETSHDVIAIAIDSHGNEVFSSGDTDRPFFYRSAIKPFQALASLRAGAELSDEQLAVTCASHGGFPAHLATVELTLNEVGLGVDDLRCPPSQPLNDAARRIQERHGRWTRQRVFHNCSGKHSGWLAGCVAAGWDVETYLNPNHEVQRSVIEVVSEATHSNPEPVGVDGCGAPTLRGSVRTLAAGFRTLTTDAEFARIAATMTRFSALVADNIRAEGRVGVNWGGPSKGGAEGLFAASRHGLTIVTKSLDGSTDIAVAGFLEVAGRIGALPRGTAEWLEPVAHPPVIGGGVRVGSLELVDS